MGYEGQVDISGRYVSEHKNLKDQRKWSSTINNPGLMHGRFYLLNRIGLCSLLRWESNHETSIVVFDFIYVLMHTMKHG